jgi:hypothetical protein
MKVGAIRNDIGALRGNVCNLNHQIRDLENQIHKKNEIISSVHEWIDHNIPIDSPNSKESVHIVFDSDNTILAAGRFIDPCSFEKLGKNVTLCDITDEIASRIQYLLRKGYKNR